MQSESNDHFGVTEALGPAAVVPGFHTVQVRAQLVFGRTESTTPWTETRELPRLFYAVYDGKPSAASMEVRALLEGPGAVSARQFDPDLDDMPFNAWLVNTLSTRGGTHDNAGAMWRSQYCNERTGEAGVTADPTAVCAVLDVQLRQQMGQIWFRTADVVVNDGIAIWQRTTPPRFEGFVLHGSAPESLRLSKLPTVLDTEPASRPAGDLSVDPDDILVAPASPKPGESVRLTIAIRNRGSGDVFKAAVQVVVATSLENVAARMFVVDVPAQRVTTVTLQARFPQGYGVVAATAFQQSEHSPFRARPRTQRQRTCVCTASSIRS